MASAFKTETAVDIGTGLTSVYTCPNSTTTTLIGLYICNVAGADITATVQLFNASANHHASIVNGVEIPAGSTLAPIGGDAKVVLEAGDIIKCLSNTTSSIDIVLSYLEQT
jgi:uncharacterized protein (UPF0212 family)